MSQQYLMNTTQISCNFGTFFLAQVMPEVSVWKYALIVCLWRESNIYYYSLSIAWLSLILPPCIDLKMFPGQKYPVIAISIFSSLGAHCSGGWRKNEVLFLPNCKMNENSIPSLFWLLGKIRNDFNSRAKKQRDYFSSTKISFVPFVQITLQ